MPRFAREFYQTYRDMPKVQPLVAQIGWTHNLTILQRCKDPLEREFYIRMTRKFGWSRNVLIHQIENQSYEKSLLGQTNFNKALTPEQRAQASLAVRDEYAVEYALHEASKPIGVARYRMVKRLPKELRGQLPSPAEIAKLLEDVE